MNYELDLLSVCVLFEVCHSYGFSSTMTIASSTIAPIPIAVGTSGSQVPSLLPLLLHILIILVIVLIVFLLTLFVLLDYHYVSSY